MGAKYIGTKPGVVRLGDRPILPNDTIAGPPEVVEYLLKRADFVDDNAPEAREEPALDESEDDDGFDG